MPAHSGSAAGTQLSTLESLTPSVRWSQLTEAPLAGLAFAREAGHVLAWDDAKYLYVIDVAGNRLRSSRTPVPLNVAAISDDGSQIVAVSKEGDIWWLKKNLEPRVHQGNLRHITGVALSPQGEFLAVGLSDSHTFIYDCLGRRITNLATHRPLKFLAFLAGQPFLVGAAEYGLVGCYELDGEPRWQDALWSSVGHLAASGEGYAILVSCFSHGLQRYGLDGTNEGTYHLGGGVARAAIDYDGKLFAAATLEGEILIVNAAGHVLWRQTLSRPAREIVLDPAGQFVLHGQESGEITMLDLFGAEPAAQSAKRPQEGQPVQLRPPTTAEDTAAAGSTGGPPAGVVPAERQLPEVAQLRLRKPTWQVPAFDSQSQAETAVLQLVLDPLRVVVFSNRRRVDVFADGGQRIHSGDIVTGVGRYLDANPSIVTAATDRELLVYDVAANDSFRFDQRFVMLSHLRIDSEAGEIVVIEERDRLSRWDVRGNRRWIKTIDSPVEELAIGSDRTCAVTTEDGRLFIFDDDKRIVGEFRADRREALSVVRLGPRWITLAGKSQQVRCHQLDGSVEWETLLPTEAWRLVRLASRVVARAANGRLFVVDARGRIVLDSTELPFEAILFVNRSGEASAVFWRAGNLMVTDLVGRVQWRHLSAETLGPVAAGEVGVACALGRELAFFADQDI